jgi:membrane-associated phospholipid phosphatase
VTVGETRSRAVAAAAVRPASAVTALYLAVSAVPLAAGGLGGGRVLVLAAHVAAVALIFLAEKAHASGSPPRWARDVSSFHLLVLIPMLYAELPLLMEGMPGEVVYHDPAVQAIEARLFGFQPAWELAGRWPSLLVSELLHLAYVLYYPIVYVPPLLLYLHWWRGRETVELILTRRDVKDEPPPPPESRPRKRSLRHRWSPAAIAARGRPAWENRPRPTLGQLIESEFLFQKALLALALSMLSCYLVFVLWPVQGPRYLAAPQGAPEGPVRSLVLAILEGGSSRGAAFPSSHVAVAVTQTLLLLRYRRRLGIVLAGLTLLLALGAVYGGFHYAVDALAGAAVGAVAWFASGLIQRPPEEVAPGFAPTRPPV